MTNPLENLFKAFGYTISLPERTLRSLAGALGGTTKLLTDTLIPEPLRRTHTFTALVGNAQRFLIERIAEVQGVYRTDDGTAPPNDFVARKVAGNVLEAAGMFSIHLSPLWLFAIVADAAQGSKVYLDRLVSELKEKKVLGEEVQVRGVDDLLQAIGQAGQESAKVFEAPPLNPAQIRELRDQILGGYAGVLRGATGLLPQMDTLWNSMQSLARRDGVAMEAIAGLMTLDLGAAAGKAVGAAMATGGVATDLLEETVFRSYGETIDRIQREGAIACLDEAARPYMAAIADQMHPSKQTWTERAWRRMTAWAGDAGAETGEEQAEPPTEPPRGERAGPCSTREEE